jgi:hypothetical protein
VVCLSPVAQRPDSVVISLSGPYNRFRDVGLLQKLGTACACGPFSDKEAVSESLMHASLPFRLGAAVLIVLVLVRGKTRPTPGNINSDKIAAILHGVLG